MVGEKVGEMAVIHRIGGLESNNTADVAQIYVIHRIGGLETYVITASHDDLVIHRIGGLETTPKPTIGQIVMLYTA